MQHQALPAHCACSAHAESCNSDAPVSYSLPLCVSTAEFMQYNVETVTVSRFEYYPYTWEEGAHQCACTVCTPICKPTPPSMAGAHPRAGTPSLPSFTCRCRGNEMADSRVRIENQSRIPDLCVQDPRTTGTDDSLAWAPVLSVVIVRPKAWA